MKLIKIVPFLALSLLCMPLAYSMEGKSDKQLEQQCSEEDKQQFLNLLPDETLQLILEYVLYTDLKGVNGISRVDRRCAGSMREVIQNNIPEKDKKDIGGFIKNWNLVIPQSLLGNISESVTCLSYSNNALHLITELLIKSGACINKRGGSKDLLPLEAAASSNNLMMVKELLAQGADATLVRDDNGRFHIHFLHTYFMTTPEHKKIVELIKQAKENKK